jgi:hypothetical protein
MLRAVPRMLSCYSPPFAFHGARSITSDFLMVFIAAGDAGPVQQQQLPFGQRRRCGSASGRKISSPNKIAAPCPALERARTLVGIDLHCPCAALLALRPVQPLAVHTCAHDRGTARRRAGCRTLSGCVEGAEHGARRTECRGTSSWAAAAAWPANHGQHHESSAAARGWAI